MKKMKHMCLAVLAVSVWGLAACTQHEEMPPAWSGQTINLSFSLGDVQTRVDALGEGGAWEAGDKIRVEASTMSRTTSASLVYDAESGSWSHHDELRWLDDDIHTLTAMYPAAQAMGRYDQVTDQRTWSYLKSADIITGFWYGAPRTENLSIPMKHRMTRITIECHMGTADYPYSSIDELQIYVPHSVAFFDVDYGKSDMVLTPNDSPVWVKAYNQNNGQFSAIIIPCAYSEGDTFLKFSLIAHGDFKVPLKSAREFKEGGHYTFRLNVGKDRIDLTEISVDEQFPGTGWNDEVELNG